MGGGRTEREHEIEREGGEEGEKTDMKNESASVIFFTTNLVSLHR